MKLVLYNLYEQFVIAVIIKFTHLRVVGTVFVSFVKFKVRYVFEAKIERMGSPIYQVFKQKL